MDCRHMRRLHHLSSVRPADTLELARDRRLLLAGANIVLSVVLCPTAVALGHWLAALFGRA